VSAIVILHTNSSSELTYEKFSTGNWFEVAVMRRAPAVCVVDILKSDGYSHRRVAKRQMSIFQKDKGME